MNKIISLIIASILCFCCLFGCSENDNSANSQPITPDNSTNNSTTDTPVDSPSSQEVPVSSITMSKHSITMTVGDTTEITVSITPNNATNKNITWSSTNGNVAEYINGKIYALGEGSCIIKATTVNGIVDICNVTVKKAPVYAQTVSFGEDTYYLSIGQKISTSLSVKPTKLDSYNGKITFSKNNIATATYSNDSYNRVSIIGVAEGETTITVTLDGGKQATAKIVVSNASNYVKINLPSLPKTVSYIHDRSYSNEDHIYSSVRIDSIKISYIYHDKNTIYATLTINGTKSYDEDGNAGSTGINYDIALYKENGVFCDRTTQTEIAIYVGEKFTDSYTFAIALDNNKTIRKFTIEILDHVI